MPVRRAAAAPGPDISRYERPRAVRRSRSGVLSLHESLAPPLSSTAAAGDTDEPEIAYAPEADGEPDPGEVVWAWVPYEDDPEQGKDRPVLLLARSSGETGDEWLGLMLSSRDHDADAADGASWGRYWMDVGSGDWDHEAKPSEVRLDRLLRLPESGIRREGSALDRARFDEVVARAGEFHTWG